jgi:hypothetical protein
MLFKLQARLPWVFILCQYYNERFSRRLGIPYLANYGIRKMTFSKMMRTRMSKVVWWGWGWVGGFTLGFAYRALSLNEEPHLSSTTIFCGDSRSSSSPSLYESYGNAAQQRHSPTNKALWRESSSIRCLLSTVQDASWNLWPMIPSKSPYVLHQAISAIFNFPDVICILMRSWGLSNLSRFRSRQID